MEDGLYDNKVIANGGDFSSLWGTLLTIFDVQHMIVGLIKCINWFFQRKQKID